MLQRYKLYQWNRYICKYLDCRIDEFGELKEYTYYLYVHAISISHVRDILAAQWDKYFTSYTDHIVLLGIYLDLKYASYYADAEGNKIKF